jgi:hypothetical protein
LTRLEALDRRSVPRWYTDAKLGIFVDAAATRVDLTGWARSFARAGAQYVVMVTRHLDGFVAADGRQFGGQREGK